MHRERKVLFTKLWFNLQLDISIAAFQEICPTSIRDKFQFQVSMSKISVKLNATLKISISLHLFKFSDQLVPKVEICLKYFFDKNSKSSHCDIYEVKPKFELQQVHRKILTLPTYLFMFSSLEKEIFQSLTLEQYLQENTISISHALMVTFKL